MPRLRLPFLVCVPTVFLMSCSVENSADPADAETVSANDAGNDTPPTAPSAAGSSSLWNGGETRALDLQSAHPNGVVLQLTSLQSRPTETAIGVRVMNGRDREIQLNRFNNRNGYIVLDNGERLYLSPPANNTRVSIPAGQTLEGELVFLGRLPSVKSAVLILNENATSDNQHTTTPGFRIDLPLAASGS